LNTEPDPVVLLETPDPEVFDDQINVDIKFNFSNSNCNVFFLSLHKRFQSFRRSLKYH
jgi:hypothetical protein